MLWNSFINLMAKVECTIETGYVENDSGYEIEGVIATCSRCEHTVKSCGTSDGSRRRCLVLMRQECPNDESNYYEEG